jgi:hypothetical protein
MAEEENGGADWGDLAWSGSHGAQLSADHPLSFQQRGETLQLLDFCSLFLCGGIGAVYALQFLGGLEQINQVHQRVLRMEEVGAFGQGLDCDVDGGAHGDGNHQLWDAEQYFL